MTVYIASTSENLQVASDLISLANQKPAISLQVAGDFWDDLINQIAQAVSGIFNGIVGGITDTINSIKDTITGIINPIVTQVSDAVSGVINGITGGISDAIQNFINWIQSAIQSISDWVSGAIQSVKDAIGSIGEWFKSAYYDIADWIEQTINGISSAVAAWIEQTAQDIGAWVKGVYENVAGWINGAITSAGEWINGVYQAVKDWIEGAYNTIQNVVESAKVTVADWLGKFLAWFLKIRDELVAFFWKTMSNIGAWFAREVMPRFGNVVKSAQQLIAIFSRVWELVSKGDFTGAFSIVDSLFKEAGIPAPISTLHSIVSAIAYFWETIHIQFVPLEVAAQKQAVISLGMDPIDNSTMAQAVFKGQASIGDFIKNAALGGVSAERARLAFEGLKNLPTPGQIQEAFLRGSIDLETHDKMLTAYGLSSEYINLIRELYLLIPGPSDLIRMAVREAFTPEIAQKFGQYEDYPQAFTDWAAKIGLSKDWATRYWAAHWDLPSPTMGFEMLHRGIIDNDELKLLLRALDVMPYWRERLIKLSYNPLTRVDVRRMYQLGVIDASQVTRAYLDLGYDQEKAEWLTEFTTRYYNPEDYTERDEFKNMARGVYSQAFKKRIISEDEYRKFLLEMKYHPDDAELLITIDQFSMSQDDKLFSMKGYRQDWQKLLLQAYDRGLIHQNELSALLSDLGYSQEESELEISLSDYNRSLKLRNMVAERIHDQYVDFVIDVTGMHTILDQFNFTPEEIAKLEEEWNIERSFRGKRPPITDLKKFYASGLISLDDLLDELRGNGYHEKYISMYAQTLSKA